MQKLVTFSHLAVLGTIVSFFFPKKSGPMGLTMIDLVAFNPIPFPTITLAATVVSIPFPVNDKNTESFCVQIYNCLEEYDTGKHIIIDCSEREYLNYYEKIMVNLNKYADSSRKQLIADLQDSIFEAGM